MDEIIFVTSSEDKAAEARAILGIKVTAADLDIPEIQSIKVEEVVLGKAKAAYETLDKPVIVEDTGLYLKAMNGFPGALIKWLLDSIGPAGICRLVQGMDRSAEARTCVCLYNGWEPVIFTGSVKGAISDCPRGKGGFGWDPVFVPEGSDETFAEMPGERKNAISMRRAALEKLGDHLSKAPPNKSPVQI
jgi:non-canonical purine NTP pyrophosphatase (RdgB/HAM1 family)